MGTTVDEYPTYSLAGLELAKYVLMRLVENEDIEKNSENFDGDVRFINGIIEFLVDIGWGMQDQTNGSYRITDIGRVKANASKMIVWI